MGGDNNISKSMINFEAPVMKMNKTILFCGMLGLSTMVKAQEFHDSRLEVVASFGQSQPIGVSVSSKNRVFVSFPHREPYLFGLTEIINGKRVAYPNADWNASNGERNDHFVNVQDIYVDSKDQLWVLDSKPGSGNSVFGKAAGDAEE